MKRVLLLAVTMGLYALSALAVEPAALVDPITGMEFVLVKGGCFQMGDAGGNGYADERPVHEVCVDDFYLGRYEVTQEQWQRVMAVNPSRFNKGGRQPVEQVSWDDVQAFTATLAALGSKTYRLPSEAEWEYAARSGGLAQTYAGGSDLGNVAWFGGNSGGQPHPVGQKAANGLGLFDMSGNLDEWVADRYGSDYYASSPKANPQGPATYASRVVRGGNFESSPKAATTSKRDMFDPKLRAEIVGFRLALSAH